MRRRWRRWRSGPPGWMWDLVGGLLQLSKFSSVVKLHPPAVSLSHGPGDGAVNEVIADDAESPRDVRRPEPLDAATLAPGTSHRIQDMQMALRALMEQELQTVKENVDLLAREEVLGIEEGEDAMDVLDRELWEGRMPLCRYVKAVKKDVAPAQFFKYMY
ncbi:hypothetical protein ACP4OV_012735 [Aristida adscensionis]